MDIETVNAPLLPSYEMSQNDLYEIALEFFKKNKEKAFHLSYNKRIEMYSLINYIKYGSCDKLDKLPEFGLFDVVGKDIKRKWQYLSNTDRSKAQDQFIKELCKICPEFSGYLEAVVKDKQNEIIKKQEEYVKAQEDRAREDEQLRAGVELETKKRLDQESRLRELLNERTLPQFKEYAIQQFPNSLYEQEKLIAQLQQHHFHQYMLAIYSKCHRPPTDCNNRYPENGTVSSADRSAQSQSIDADSASGNISNSVQGNDINNIVHGNDNINSVHGDGVNQVSIEEYPEKSSNKYTCDRPIIKYHPSMLQEWCSSLHEDVLTFKSSCDSDCILKIGSGEVVTIKVPALPTKQAKYLEWQFTTDTHDIGFGISVSMVGDIQDSNQSPSLPSDAAKEDNTLDPSNNTSDPSNITSDPSNNQSPSLPPDAAKEDNTSDPSNNQSPSLPADAAKEDNISDPSNNKSDLSNNQSPSPSLPADAPKENNTSDPSNNQSPSPSLPADAAKKVNNTPLSPSNVETIDLRPINRRDSHVRVHGGRIPLLENTVDFQLKFDNSYSLWRPKTLYYRVCYIE